MSSPITVNTDRAIYSAESQYKFHKEFYNGDVFDANVVNSYKLATALKLLLAEVKRVREDKNGTMPLLELIILDTAIHDVERVFK